MYDRLLDIGSVGHVDRRTALKAAGGMLGLNLSTLWRAQSAQARSTSSVVPTTSPIKSCIIVFYYGGPSHLDTYDMKPEGPSDIRGEFRPIATSAPGIFVSEHLPMMSRVMHKCALIRSIHHTNRLHDSASTEALTGRQSPVGDREEFAPISQFYPSYGASLSYVWQDRQIDIPHAALPFVFHNVIDTPCQGGGFLGNRFDPLQVTLDVEAQLSQTVGHRRWSLNAVDYSIRSN